MNRICESLARTLTVLVGSLAFGAAASADPLPEPPSASAGRDEARGLARACLAAAAEAEATLGLPPGVLAALAVVESTAHPYAIGTPARSLYPPTRDEALRLARSSGAGAAGGCFQLTLSLHARRDPGLVFDPWASALVAGRLLARHAAAAAGDWGVAVARYAGAGVGSTAARRQRCRVAASLDALGHPAARGLGPEGCRQAETSAARAKAVAVAARARGPEAVAALP